MFFIIVLVNNFFDAMSEILFLLGKNKQTNKFWYLQKNSVLNYMRKDFLSVCEIIFSIDVLQ